MALHRRSVVNERYDKWSATSPMQVDANSPKGRSLAELTVPNSPLMPTVEIFDLHLAEIEATLRPSVPEPIRQRIRTARNVAVHGAFSYDLFTVSIAWSYTCLEMALWTKFREMNPDKTPPSTLRPLSDWAKASRLFPPTLHAPESLVRLRNSFAHPKESNFVLTPAMALDAFQLIIEIVNHLWPLDVPR